MNVLYMSCHEVLEYDELKLLSSLPIGLRSTGAYADPTQHPTLRPALPQLEYNKDHINNSFHFNTDQVKLADETVGDHVLTDELLEWADVVIYMHMPTWVFRSVEILDKYPKVRIIYRSIGQQSPNDETMLRNYKLHFGSRFTIVRYSPNEQHIANYQKSDALIRFYKDPNDFEHWTLPDKSDRFILLSTQAAPERGNFVHIDQALEITEGLPRKIVGPRNESLAPRLEVLNPTYEELTKLYSKAGMLFYTGTVPAPYTLTFVEAIMSGLPVITISGAIWAAEHLGWIRPEVLEVPDLIGTHCMITDIEKDKDYLTRLLYDDDLLKHMSAFNRGLALSHFNSEDLPGQANSHRGIRRQWATLLGL